MESNKIKTAGINRSHERSITQKWTFAFGHFVIVLFCIWLIYFNGWQIIGNIFGKEWVLGDPDRAIILLVCTIIYWFRHIFTLFYLLQRKVDWSEVLGLLVFIALFEIGLVLLGGGAFREYSIKQNWLDIAALTLFLFGSYLNSFSEYQRKRWKNEKVNKGHCYTDGLFSYSVHINYFGDTILFTGWCLFTQNYWTLSLPFLMGCLFTFFHIPGLDSYLSGKYGKEFCDYSARTKVFIPFIY